MASAGMYDNPKQDRQSLIFPQLYSAPQFSSVNLWWEMELQRAPI